MTNFLKRATALILIAVMGACSTGASSVTGCLQSDPTLCVERLDLTGKEGASTYDAVTQSGVVVKLERTNETSTFGQDAALTAIGAATGPLINGITANVLSKRNKCDGDCGTGGGQQVVQVQVDASSNSTSGTSQTSAPCTTGCGEVALPSTF